MLSAQDWIDGGNYFTRENGQNLFYRRTGPADAPVLVLLHGFPTWSYDYVEVAADLERDHHVIAMDFLGYGASDKPKRYNFSVPDHANMTEELILSLGLGPVTLVVHDYADTVCTELMDRHRNGALRIDIAGVHMMNGGVMYEAYRPTKGQKALLNPLTGWWIARQFKGEQMRAGMNAVRGKNFPMSDAEFEGTVVGITIDKGYRQFHRLQRYILERAKHGQRWSDALADWDKVKPLNLIWGPDDPVSGEHVLSAAKAILPNATVHRLPGVGHFVPSEDPAGVIKAIRNPNG